MNQAITVKPTIVRADVPITIQNKSFFVGTTNGVLLMVTLDDFGLSIESSITDEKVIIDTGVLNDIGDPPVFNLVTCDKKEKVTSIRDLSKSWCQETQITESNAATISKESTEETIMN